MNTVLGAACAVLAAIALVGFPLAGLRLDLAGAAGSVFSVVALLALYLRYRKRDLPRLRDTALFTFWGVLLSTLYLLPMYVLARRALPFRDDALRAADAMLGIEVPRVLAWMSAHPRTRQLFDVSYDTLQFGCLFALMVPPLAGKPERTRTLLFALVFASFGTLAMFAIFRAIGPWEAYSLSPTPWQQGCGEACRALESAAPYVVDLRRPDPLIAFPSWHAILAVLAALSLAGIRFLLVPSIVWGALVVLSTVTTGWHYLTDSLAGVLFAVAAWAIGTALDRRLSRASTRQATYSRSSR